VGPAEQDNAVFVVFGKALQRFRPGVLCQNPVRIENIDISVTSKQASES
jgi:hypothetical protein